MTFHATRQADRLIWTRLSICFHVRIAFVFSLNDVDAAKIVHRARNLTQNDVTMGFQKCKLELGNWLQIEV